MNEGQADRTYSVAEITKAFILGSQFGAEMMRDAAARKEKFSQGEIESLTSAAVKTLLELLNQEESKG